MYMAVSNVDIVDIPFLIKNETKVPIGIFEEETTFFKEVRVVKTKGSSHFVISDSAGYLTTLVKNLRLKSRIHSATNDIIQLKTQNNNLMILQERAIGFSAIFDNKIAPFYCEGSFSSKLPFVAFEVENYRAQSTFMYAHRSNGEITVFDFNYLPTSSEAGKCSSVAQLQVPEEFSKGEQVALTSIRGAMIL